MVDRCEYCNADMDFHDREHLATTCYPVQLDALRAKVYEQGQRIAELEAQAASLWEGLAVNCACRMWARDNWGVGVDPEGQLREHHPHCWARSFQPPDAGRALLREVEALKGLLSAARELRRWQEWAATQDHPPWEEEHRAVQGIFAALAAVEKAKGK